MTCDAFTGLLDRHLDGELAASDRSRLEAHLADCPACALEALRRRELQAAVREAGRAFEPGPGLRARLADRLAREAGRGAPRRHPWSLSLAAALLVGLALAALWTGTRAAGAARATRQAVDLHVAALAETARLDVLSSDAHTVKPWFEGKIPFAFDLPDLSGTAWELAGGRLVEVDGEKGAQLILKIRKHRVSVFVLGGEGGPGRAPVASAPADRGGSRGFRLLSWTANGLRYVAVSDTGAEDLGTLADRFLRASRS